MAAREWTLQGVGLSVGRFDGPVQLSPMVTYVTQWLYFVGASI